MPVVEITPPVVARPCSCVAKIELAQVTPPCADRAPRRGINGYRLHQGKIDHHPALNAGSSGDVVAASANGDLQAVLPRECDAGGDVSLVLASRMTAGCLSIKPLCSARTSS